MKIKFIFFCLLNLMLACVAFGAENPAKIKVLLITGGHGFEKEPFYKVFKINPEFGEVFRDTEVNFTVAEHNKTNASAFDRDDLLTYDVVVLYDMQKRITDEQKAKFLSLFDKGIGLVVLHHAIVSYQSWPDYERIIGGRYPEPENKAGQVTEELGYLHDQEVPIVIVAKDHPITEGMQDFVIHDEIYWGFRIGKDVTTLITTTNPKSGKPLMWCRTEGKSRVVYLQLGHDHSAYENPNYRKLVARSIRWVAPTTVTKQ